MRMSKRRRTLLANLEKAMKAKLEKAMKKKSEGHPPPSPPSESSSASADSSSAVSSDAYFSRVTQDFQEIDDRLRDAFKRMPKASKKLQVLRQKAIRMRMSRLTHSTTQMSTSIAEIPAPKTADRIRRNIIQEVSSCERNKDTDVSSPRLNVIESDILTAIFDEYSNQCYQCGARLDLKLEEFYGNHSAKVSCRVCDYEKTFLPKCLEKNYFTEQNINLIYESFEDGRGYMGYHKVCSSLGLEPLSKAHYYEVKDYIGSKVFDMRTLKDEMLYKCLVHHYANLDEPRYPDKNGVLSIDVSFDGSLQKRGHSSHIGVGVVIDVYTGFAIDFHVCSIYCAASSRNKEKREKKEITEEEYRALIEAHKESCNFDAAFSSDAMEAEEARVLWGRSLTHKLRYVNFIGDGDSSAYNEVISMNDNEGPYGNIKVVKCANNRICNEDFLQGGLVGKTKNPNESLHARIKAKLSKIKFLGLKTIKQSVCLTVLQHNWGYYEAYPLKKTGFGCMNTSMAKLLRLQDKDKTGLLEETLKMKGSRLKGKSKKTRIEENNGDQILSQDPLDIRPELSEYGSEYNDLQVINEVDFEEVQVSNEVDFEEEIIIVKEEIE